MYEHFLTDLAGHTQDMEHAALVLENLEALLDGLLSHLDLFRHLVVLASDHGNIEDLSTKQHTLNCVSGPSLGGRSRRRRRRDPESGRHFPGYLAPPGYAMIHHIPAWGRRGLGVPCALLLI